MKRCGIVVPTCRGFTIPKLTIEATWYIVHDREEREIINNTDSKVVNIIAPDPTMWGARCDSIRSAGFLEAYKDGMDYILTVDDDCFIPSIWAERHVQALMQEVHPWSYTVFPHHIRGMPYLARSKPVAVTHGLWDGILDLDAKTQQQVGEVWCRIREEWRRIHPPFSLCAMNVGIRREALLTYYQPFQGDGTPFNRYADIWGGLFAQKVLQAHDYAFLNGGAVVYHTRQSDPEKNREVEKPGMECHERFWKWIWDWQAPGGSLVGDYLALADRVEAFTTPIEEQQDYFKRLAENMRRWVKAVGDAS